MAWLTRSPLWAAPLTAGRQIDYPSAHSLIDVAAAEARIVPLHIINPAHANTDIGDAPRPIIYDGVSRLPLHENANSARFPTLESQSGVFNGRWHLNFNLTDKGGLIIPNSQMRSAMSFFIVAHFSADQITAAETEFLLWTVHQTGGSSPTNTVLQITKTSANKILWQVGAGLNALSSTTLSAGTYLITAIYDPDDDDFATGKGLQLWIDGVLEDEDDTDADGAGPNPPLGITQNSANVLHIGSNAGGSSGFSGRIAFVGVFEGNIAKATGAFLAGLHDAAEDNWQ